MLKSDKKVTIIQKKNLLIKKTHIMAHNNEYFVDFVSNINKLRPRGRIFSFMIYVK